MPQQFPSSLQRYISSASSSSSSYITGATNATLTQTGTTLGLNLSNANTWLAVQTLSRSALAATSADAAILDNPTAATSTVQQVSPALRWKSRGWNTTTATSNELSFRAFVSPNAAASIPSSTWKLQTSINSGITWTDVFSVDGGITGSVKITPITAQSNGAPGMTRAMTFENSGAYTWIDFKFSGLNKANIGANSSGGIDLYASGGNYVGFYNRNTRALMGYVVPDYMAHYGYGAFLNGINVGTIAQPTSTLKNTGSTALKVKRMTDNGALDGTATHWLIDATTAAGCTGTPTYACSHWTNQSDCELRNSHGGCTWFAGNSCDTFNYEYDMGSCSGQSGCNAQTASCGGATDEASCYMQDDSYGGNCTWENIPQTCDYFDEYTCSVTAGCSVNSGDCSSFNGNESACVSTTGCTTTSGNTCSSQPDESSCISAGCSWDGSTCTGDNSVCGGTYFINCSGSYDSYTCTGTYYTGICEGTYGAACTGTSSCSGISGSGACGGEAGCTWSSVLTATLPDGETCYDRTYWIYNDSSGGQDVVIVPYSGQTVNEGSSYTLAAYRDWVHLAYYKKTANCSGLGESTCLTTSGCTANYSSCSWDTGSASCTGGAGCNSYTDEASCNSATYYSDCAGSYAVSKNWYKFGS